VKSGFEKCPTPCPPGDIFCRYQSFRDEKDLRAALRDKIPSKIDLGGGGGAVQVELS
jgi:hypothetical protein